MYEQFKIVQTDNHGGDYPNESFVEGIPTSSKERMQVIADAINKIFCGGDGASRFWKVVPSEYKLQPGFEP